MTTAASTIPRPILKAVDAISVRKYVLEWTNYTARVHASDMEESKKRTALNHVPSFSSDLIQYIIEYELPAAGIYKQPRIVHPGGIIPAVHFTIEDLSSALIEQWLSYKKIEQLGMEETDRITAQLVKEFNNFNGDAPKFSYDPGMGSLRQQLQFYTTKVNERIRGYGLMDTLTSTLKITLWITRLKPWAAIKNACIIMAQPAYSFKSFPLPFHELHKNYAAFVEEVIWALEQHVAAALPMNPSFLFTLPKTKITPEERNLLGTRLADILNQTYPNYKGQATFLNNIRSTQPLLPAKRLASYPPRPDIRNRSANTQAGRLKYGPNTWRAYKMRRIEYPNQEEMERQYYRDNSDSDDTNLAMDVPDPIQYTEENYTTPDYQDTEDSTMIIDDLSEDSGADEEELNTMEMRAIHLKDKRGLQCSNCGKAGHFSTNCTEVCKFCKKAGCNSWTCFQRNLGYGSRKPMHISQAQLSAKTKTIQDRNNRPYPVHSAFKKGEISYQFRIVKLADGLPSIQATVITDGRTEGVENFKLLVDTGAEKCSITSALLQRVQTELQNSLLVEPLPHRILAEFADHSTRECSEHVNLPLLKLIVQPKNTEPKQLRFANVDCVVMPSNQEELILGNWWIKDILGINVLDLIAHLDSDTTYDGKCQTDFNAWSYDQITQTAVRSTTFPQAIDIHDQSYQYAEMLPDGTWHLQY